MRTTTFGKTVGCYPGTYTNENPNSAPLVKAEVVIPNSTFRLAFRRAYTYTTLNLTQSVITVDLKKTKTTKTNETKQRQKETHSTKGDCDQDFLG